MNVGEVRARILQISIEKEFKQCPIEIIMKRDVVLRLAHDVIFRSVGQHNRAGAVQARHQIEGEEVEHIIKRALLDG